MKVPVVELLYNKDEKICSSNHRPLSVMTFFSKEFNKLCTVPYWDTNENNRLVGEQFGFRKDLTTEEATCDVLINPLNAELNSICCLLALL